MNRIQQSNRRDTIRISEKSTEYRDQLVTKHDLHHCRTKCNVRKTNFGWSIENFWNICNFMDILTSSDIEGESYKIDMCINREEHVLYFFIRCNEPNSKEQINIYRYRVYIQGIEGIEIYADWKRFYLNPDPLFEVCLKTLRLNEATYLPNNTLSIHFTFESYETIFHMTMYENIIDEQKLTAAKNNSVSDESNLIVTFVVDGERLRVNKSLLCAASPIFNEILNKQVDGEAEKEIELNHITYDIFKIIILYINAEGVLDLKFGANDTTQQKNILLSLLAASHKYHVYNLKVMCEKRLLAFITKENVVTFLDIAINNNAVYLETYAKRFIKLHLDDIKYTMKFFEKMEINPLILSDINELELDNESAFYIKYNGD